MKELLNGFPPQLQRIASRDEPLALALKALLDLLEDSDFAEAKTLNEAIATRIELLAIKQKTTR